MVDINELKKLLSLKNNLGEKVTLVGAIKTVDADRVNLAIKNGLQVVAENKVQEFKDKYSSIIGATHHFIGHLQTNKVKYIVGKVSLIHSVDTIKLAKEIDKESNKKKVVSDILIQINAGNESSKSGFPFNEVEKVLKEISSLSNLKVKGLMAMLPNLEDKTQLEKLCLQMRSLYDILKNKGYDFTYLSMGMSNDYEIAVNNGSNMIRLGSKIFGKRNYEVK